MLNLKETNLYRPWVVVSGFWVAFSVLASIDIYGFARFLHFKGAVLMALESFLPPILTYLLFAAVLAVSGVSRRVLAGR